MKKLAIEETFPRNDIAKNIICNRMKSHYKRIYGAKAKVDTNLPKPAKNSVPLSQEICDIVDRNYYCYKKLPKHRKCLKELEEAGFHFKPIILNSNAESKLKTLDVYYPPVKTPRRTKSRQSIQYGPDKSDEQAAELVNEEVNHIEIEEVKEPEEQKTVIEKVPIVTKKEIWVQTDHIPKQKSKKEQLYRPRSSRSIHFLRDITDDVLSKGVYSDESLEGIFDYHVTVNKYKLDMETMLNEIDRLRDEVGIKRPGLRRSTHSDDEALEALDSLQLDPNIKEDIITSLRLGSRESYHNAVIESQSSSSDNLTPVLMNNQYNTSAKEDLEQEKESVLQQLQQEPLSKMIEQDGHELEKVTENIDIKEENTRSTTSEVSDIEDIEYDDVEQTISNNEDDIDDEEEKDDNEDKEEEGDNEDDGEKEDNKKNNSSTESVKSITQTLSVIKEESLKEISSKTEQSLKEKSNENINDLNKDNRMDNVGPSISEKEISTQSDSVSSVEQINTEIISKPKEESEDAEETEEESKVKTEKPEDNSPDLSRSNSSSDMTSIHTEPSLEF